MDEGSISLIEQNFINAYFKVLFEFKRIVKFKHLETLKITFIFSGKP